MRPPLRDAVQTPPLGTAIVTKPSQGDGSPTHQPAPSFTSTHAEEGSDGSADCAAVGDARRRHGEQVSTRAINVVSTLRQYMFNFAVSLSAQPRTSPLPFSNKRRHRVGPQNHRTRTHNAVFTAQSADANDNPAPK